jgi:zinc D-Ala-D-Ala dipeptidase
MIKHVTVLLLMSISFIHCKQEPKPILPKEKEVVKEETKKEKVQEVAPIKNAAEKKETTSKPIPSDWTEIDNTSGIAIDIKYATKDNFTKKKIYDCGKCYLRPEAAAKLVEIHNFLQEKYGYGIKVFDCFRPRPYQQRLWDIKPDPSYVTPPEKGSMHSRGLAVDLTIVDKNGKDLDMGTPYDFFGKEAHQDYKGHSADINKNRKLLKSIMEENGFGSIRTEWWHYSYRTKSYPLDDWAWECE